MKFENERVLWPLLRVWFLLLFWRVCGVGEAHRREKKKGGNKGNREAVREYSEIEIWREDLLQP